MLSAFVLVGIVTITLSTYMILYSQSLYERVASWLRPFERRIPFRELEVSAGAEDSGKPRVIVFGLGRYGSRLAHQLSADGLPLDCSAWIVSTLPDLASSRTLLHALGTHGAWRRTAVVARDDSQAQPLAEAGAAAVIHPFRDAADFVGAQLNRMIMKDEEEVVP